MAGNRVVLTFIGEDGPLSRTLKKVDGDANKLGTGLGRLTKSIMSIGAVGGAVQGVAALGTSLVQMSGAALLAPAGILAAGAAMVTAKLAAKGFSDALGGNAKAMAGLAPEARATVTALDGMKSQWKAVQQVVQGNVFRGVSGDVKELGGSYLPVLKTGLGGIATGFNSIARNALGALKTPEAIGSVKAVLDATGSSVGHMSESLGNVVSGFLNLAGAGAKFLAGTGTGITNLTGKFDAWTQKITADGSFEKWVKAAGAAFGQLFAVIGNIGHIVVDVISGLSGPTEGLFSSLERVTGMIRTFLESAQGQAALTALGTALRTVSDATGSILAAGLSQIGPLIVAAAPFVAQLATAIGTALAGAIRVVGPLLTGFATFLSNTPGAATVLLGVVTGLFAAFKIGQAVMAGVRVASMLMAAWPTIVAVATGIWTAAQWLLNAALSANPIALVVIAIVALVAGIIWAWNNCETFRTIVIAVWNAVKGAIVAAVDWIKGAIGWFGNLPGLVGGWFGRMKDAAIAKGVELVGWVRRVPGMIGDAIGNLGSLLVNAGGDLLRGLWNGISDAAGWLKSKVLGFFGSILPGWAKDILGIASPSKVFADLGQWIPKGMSVGIDHNVGSVITSAKNMTDAAVSAGQVGTAALNAPSMPGLPASGAGGGNVRVDFTGNTSDAFAAAFMQLVRTGKIQLTAV